MDLNREMIRKLRGLVVFTVAAVVIGVHYREVFAAVMRFMGMLAPFLVGAAIAFVLNVPMRFIEKSISGGRVSKWRRPVSLILSFLLVVGILIIVAVLVVPELFRTIMSLEQSVPAFFAGVQQQLNQLFASYPDIAVYLNQIQIDWEQVLKQLLSFLSDGAGTVLSTTFSAAMSIASGVTCLGIGLVFAIYILLQKETLMRQAKNLIRAFLPKKIGEMLLGVAALAEHTFSSFLAGQCLEAVILGSMFFVTLSLLRMPYALLIGVLIAFTALIPMFGAFIGCVVGAFLILITNPLQAAAFVVIFFVLQQIEGNLIYPHVVGNSVGLPSIWVLVAVTLGGSMMGVLGMLVFIPLVSVFYSLLRGAMHARLKKNSR
ncbi:MAG: AI-2E family transporter [Lachnospiraceae bacterium]|nr:AI-2E family transporter [Lachnospiraceae bacterium]